MPADIDAILGAVRRHGEEVIKPNVDSWNEAAVWPRSASDPAAALGLTGLYCPDAWGGQGLSFADGIRVYEELGQGDAAYAFALSMHNICSYAVCDFDRATSATHGLGSSHPDGSWRTSRSPSRNRAPTPPRCRHGRASTPVAPGDRRS